MEFPFSELHNWTIALWPIRVEGNHWLLFIVDKKERISLILDPSTITISAEHKTIADKLTELLYNFSYLTWDQKIRRVQVNTYQTQENSEDAGIFIIHYARQYLEQKDCRFKNCNPMEMRRDIKNLVLQYINRKTQPALQEKKTHPIIERALLYLDEPGMGATYMLNEAERAKKEMFPEKEQNIRHPMTNSKKEEDDWTLRMAYQKSPKLTYQKTINPAMTVALPTKNEIIKHYTQVEPETPDPSYAFVKVTETLDNFTNQEITADEVKRAFKSSKVSSPGEDSIRYSQWKLMDPTLQALTKLFNHIMKKLDVPEQWKSFRTTLIPKPGKEEFSYLTSSWRPIAVLDTSYRIFSKIINSRILNWIARGKLMHPNQKAIGAPNA